MIYNNVIKISGKISTYRKYLNGWHICGNLLEFVDQQLGKWNNKTNRL